MVYSPSELAVAVSELPKRSPGPLFFETVTSFEVTVGLFKPESSKFPVNVKA